MYTPILEDIIQRSKDQSQNINISKLYPSMLFIHLIDDVDVSRCLAYLCKDKSAYAENRSNLVSMLKEELESDSYPKSSSISNVSLSRKLDNIFMKLAHVNISTQEKITPILIFREVFSIDDDVRYAMDRSGFDAQSTNVNNAIRKVQKESETLEEILNVSEEDFVEVGAEPSDDSFSDYCTLLNGLAKNGKLDPLIGRQSELEEIIVSLARKKKNNPLIVGDPGVGKTALAEGLASRIQENDVPDIIANSNVYSLDIGALLAGTQFRGDFEKRLKLVIDTLQKESEQGGKPILFIDECHMIIGAGASAGGSMDMGNMLKPVLTKGDIRFFCATTHKEATSILEKDQALARRFQKIEIKEPSIEDTIKILHGVKGVFEKHHGVKYSDESIKLAVEMSSRYIKNKKLPDKAIDILDICGARNHIADDDTRVDEILKHQIEYTISKVTKIPVSSLKKEESNKIIHLDKELSNVVFGQESAVETVSDAIKISKSGLDSESKPIGSFLFVGPTGVGKTELTKQLAKTMSMELIRLDMTEYSEAHTVSKLIGSPPGYVGYDEGGALTGAVSKNPHSIILLDEFEKAHPKVWDMFLQVMDDGRLSDSHGEVIDFTNTIVIMTSNAGISDLSKNSIGFSMGESEGLSGNLTKSDIMAKIKTIFKPEFLNRLDVVYFSQLKKDNISHVVDKFMKELDAKLEHKTGMNYVLTSKAKNWLIENGYDAMYGARPLDRLIHKEIKKPSALIILKMDNSVSHNDKIINVDVSESGEKLVLSVLER